MATAFHIALDAMGGDHGPAPVLDGAALLARDDPHAHFVICGPEEAIAPLIAARPRLVGRSSIIDAEKVVNMEDKPSQALRRAKGTSMWAAVDAVADGRAGVAVSCGNTGALMAMSVMRLKLADHVDRPAIAALWPRRRGRTVVLDVGANLEATPNMLVDWAILGEAFCRAVQGVAKPRVALLNIGAEELKGHEEIRAAAALLREAAPDMDFIGFAEGTDIANGEVDVLVTDGFTGNVALKTAEGTARLIAGFLRDAFSASALTRVGAVFAAPALKALKEKMDPSGVNGGVFLGLNGVVVKSHGGADARGVASALRLAVDLGRSAFAGDIADALAKSRLSAGRESD